MATNATFEPYEYYEDQKVVGIDPDIAQAVCDVLGYDLKIEDMEFDAIVNAVVSGKADFGAAGMTVTDERKLSVDPRKYLICNQSPDIKQPESQGLNYKAYIPQYNISQHCTDEAENKAKNSGRRHHFSKKHCNYHSRQKIENYFKKSVTQILVCINCH